MKYSFETYGGPIEFREITLNAMRINVHCTASDALLLTTSIALTVGDDLEIFYIFVMPTTNCVIT